MTREEAITNLNMISIAFVDPVTREQRKLINDTFDMAIQALSQEPTEKPMCDRNICISNEYNGIGCDKCIVNKAEQEPTSEKELNKAYTFGHNKGVKAYYNEQLCTVELPEAVFRYILSLVPTEETEQEPCDKCKYFDGNSCQHYDYKVGYTQGYEDASNRFGQEPCDDAVSRDAVIYYIKGHIHEIITESGTDKNAHTNSILRALINGVETMPSVTQKSGKWIKKGKLWECSVCGDWSCCHESYCNNCGAKMVEPQESEE